MIFRVNGGKKDSIDRFYPINKSFTRLKTKDIVLDKGFFDGKIDFSIGKEIEDIGKLRIWLYKRSAAYKDSSGKEVISGLIEEKDLLAEIQTISKQETGEFKSKIPNFVFLTPVFIDGEQILSKDIWEIKDPQIWEIDKQKYILVEDAFRLEGFWGAESQHAQAILDGREEEKDKPDEFTEFKDYTYVNLTEIGEDMVLLGVTLQEEDYKVNDLDEYEFEKWEKALKKIEDAIEKIKKDAGGEELTDLDQDKIDQLEIDLSYLEEVLNPTLKYPQKVYKFDKFLKQSGKDLTALDRVNMVVNVKTGLVFSQTLGKVPRNLTEEEREIIAEEVRIQREEEAQSND